MAVGRSLPRSNGRRVTCRRQWIRSCKAGRTAPSCQCPARRRAGSAHRHPSLPTRTQTAVDATRSRGRRKAAAGRVGSQPARPEPVEQKPVGVCPGPRAVPRIVGA
jgi:hypothetical protein